MTSHGEPFAFIRGVVLTYDGDECIFWPFSRRGKGYASLRVGDKMRDAHRYICELTHGAPPTPRHHAAHSCGNGTAGCVTKGHLSWKTPIENEADKLIHGTDGRGSKNSQSKITEEVARRILHLKGEKKANDIADEFGVSAWTVYKIHKGERWSWL